MLSKKFNVKAYLTEDVVNEIIKYLINIVDFVIDRNTYNIIKKHPDFEIWREFSTGNLCIIGNEKTKGYLREFRVNTRKAIEANQVEIIEQIKLDTASKNELMRVAAMLGKKEIITHLISRGAKINNSILCLAVEAINGDFDIVKFAVENNADVNANNCFPINAAASLNKLEIIEYLVEHGADLKSSHCRAARLAHAKAYNGVYKYLIGHGAILTQEDEIELDPYLNVGFISVQKMISNFSEHGSIYADDLLDDSSYESIDEVD